jgi:hypothetical protein
MLVNCISASLYKNSSFYLSSNTIYTATGFLGVGIFFKSIIQEIYRLQGKANINT